MKAAFFDVDGTLTTTHIWRGLMDYFKIRRLQRDVHLAFRLAHYPLYFLRRLGLVSESGFRAPWAAHLAWYLRGFTLQEASQVWDWVVAEFLERGDPISGSYWREDTRAILEDHLQAGDVVVLVSSGPQPLIQRIARTLGVEHAVGTRFEVRDGRFTGRSLQPVCIDASKADMAKAHLRQLGLPVDYQASWSYADSTPDLHLLEMVGNPVAVYPDNELRTVARQRGWVIFPEEFPPR